MQYLNCPRCGLAIHVGGNYAGSECPRCRVRADIAMPMYTTYGGPDEAVVQQTIAAPH